MRYIVFVICVLLLEPTKAFATTTELTNALAGKSIVYKYSGGRGYHVKFDSSGLSYRFLTGLKPEKWWGPFPYQETTKDNGEYIVAWFEEDYGDYITLVINLQKLSLFGSGILSGKTTHFEKAEISEITEKK